MRYELRVSFDAIGHNFSVFIEAHRWWLMAQAHRLIRHILRVHKDARYFVHDASPVTPATQEESK